MAPVSILLLAWAGFFLLGGISDVLFIRVRENPLKKADAQRLACTALLGYVCMIAATLNQLL